MSTVIVNNQARSGCVVQVLWFIFIGWWLGQLWILAAWFLMVIIIGIPIAVKMLNRIPKIIANRDPAQTGLRVTVVDGVTVVSNADTPQRNILLRVMYFILVGWWASALWMELAYLACLTLLLMPVGFWMFDRVPGVVSLRR